MTAWFINLFKRKKKKLGLALGSGGAKGMAHIGVIRAFDEEQIAFDYVAGSSIGSVVGGMYAAGYGSASMMHYLSESNIFSPQSLLKFAIDGRGVEGAFDDVMSSSSFDDLILPYAAVATDLFSGEEVVVRSGNVARAMRASSAIPPLLRPVEIDGRTLVDGAFVNSVPADVVKKMGADIVIGVNLSFNLPTNEQIKRILDEKYPQNGIAICDRAKAGREYSDILLQPDLREFTSASIVSDKLFQMYEIGYETAKARMPEIKKLLKKAKIID